jgi:molecular chaperone HscB
MNHTHNKRDNYFSLLGLSVNFDLNLHQLKENYHDIQKRVHPDKFVHASDLERRLSVQKTTQINDALTTLKQPISRAIHLLSLYQVVLDDNDRLEPTFLMEQMELRETLSQVNQAADPFNELDTLLLDVKIRLDQINAILNNLFKNLLSDKQSNGEQSLLKAIKVEVLKMQFLNRLEEECLNKEEDLAALF